jgi:hypothetical protein
MKIKLTAHIHFVKYAWENEGEFQLFSVKLDDTDYRTFVNEQEIEIEVPENYDPRAQQIAALEKQKQKVMADFQQSVTDINERIRNLQALEYAETAVL